MSAKRNRIPKYGTVEINGHTYYRTIVTDAESKHISLYAKTQAELYDKEMEVWAQIENNRFCRNSSTVAEYCKKWLKTQSIRIRTTTLIDYTSKIKRYIIGPLGDRLIADVTLDDIQMALIPVSQLSASVYKSVVVLYKAIFRSAKDSRIILDDPTIHLSAKGGGIPQNKKTALTDDQANTISLRHGLSETRSGQ